MNLVPGMMTTEYQHAMFGLRIALHDINNGHITKDLPDAKKAQPTFEFLKNSQN